MAAENNNPQISISGSDRIYESLPTLTLWKQLIFLRTSQNEFSKDLVKLERINNEIEKCIKVIETRLKLV